jgi:cation:H+ antiporter
MGSAISARVEASKRVDALGSNVVGVALILGTALAISGIQSPRAGVKRDFPVALLVPIISGVLLLDGELSSVDAVLMLCAFSAWLVAHDHRGT